MLAGFESMCPLMPDEREVLPALVRARLALSLTNGAHAARARPENSSYLLQTQEPGWRLLGRLEALEDASLSELWAAFQR